jgi:pyruvate/2-oxoacid:ferredoxin oxidoreductase alpha subunit
LPFVHVFDGARVAFEYANVRLASTESLKHVAGAVESDDAEASSVAAESVANNVEMVMGHVADMLKSTRMYAFEYSGPADAESVIIATGVYAQVADEGTRRSRNEDGAKVSYIVAVDI